MTIAFDVEGIPKAQPRAKAYRRGGRAGVYDPGTANGWKMLVAAAALKHRLPKPIDSGVQLSLIFRMPRPQAHYNAKGLKGTAPLTHENRPDSDNLGKAVMDALSDCSFWRDDCLIWSLSIQKRYVCASERPGCLITIFCETI